MLSAIGLIIAIALLIVMIVKGVDMITASVVTAAIILVTSGLDFWEGLLKTETASFRIYRRIST